MEDTNLSGKKCEVCGTKAAVWIQDLRVIRQPMGERRYESMGQHVFCREHARDPVTVEVYSDSAMRRAIAEFFERGE